MSDVDQVELLQELNAMLNVQTSLIESLNDRVASLENCASLGLMNRPEPVDVKEKEILHDPF